MAKKKQNKIKKLKAFISYSTSDRKFAAVFKSALDEYNIESFLAHETLKVSEEWRTRILAELKTCNVFIPILSKKFKNSDWTGQETGLAVSRPDVLIIPIRIDSTLPFGLISYLQCKSLSRESLEITEIVHSLIKTYPRFLIPVLVDQIRYVNGYRNAERLVNFLVPYFSSFSDNEINLFVDASIKNAQVWDAYLCATEYLPDFIVKYRKKIAPKKLAILKYQITERKWFIRKTKI